MVSNIRGGRFNPLFLLVPERIWESIWQERIEHEKIKYERIEYERIGEGLDKEDWPWNDKKMKEHERKGRKTWKDMKGKKEKSEKTGKERKKKVKGQDIKWHDKIGKDMIDRTGYEKQL